MDTLNSLARPPLSAWLPITRQEMENRGWEEADVVLVSGDAYVDHPAFGIAVLGRILEKEGYKVCILPQPNWRDDLRDFKKFGKPKLFFGVSAGCMDSMVNHYTANKRLRSDDAYTPGGVAGFRPDYPTLVYTQILKELYPDTPVIIGGIEASMRRITHYDYWQNRLRPSFLVESGADALVYGMGERAIVDIARCIESHPGLEGLKKLPQLSYLCSQVEDIAFNSQADILLHSHEDCLKDKICQAENFAKVETASNRIECGRIIQDCGKQKIVINPPYPVEHQHEIDAAFDLPYTRQPHPKYKKRGEIPAYIMIRHSVNTHRGCFGGCSFCTISAHQGKQVQSRSRESILKEVKAVCSMPDFKGNLSDLGGPSANMYGMRGKDLEICRKCQKPSCIFPDICRNLHHDHLELLELYKTVRKIPSVKKCFVGSGIRYDLLMPDLKTDENHGRSYICEVIRNGVSGRLKVAPEHTEDKVLQLMRKMPFSQFETFKSFFDRICRENDLNLQLIPYFISSHPGCELKDMKTLAEKTKKMGYKLEQVQNFTPTPMTLSTEMYYTGINPYTMEKVYVARSKEERTAQNDCFFWYKPKSASPRRNKRKF